MVPFISSSTVLHYFLLFHMAKAFSHGVSFSRLALRQISLELINSLFNISRGNNFFFSYSRACFCLYFTFVPYTTYFFNISIHTEMTLRLFAKKFSLSVDYVFMHRGRQVWFDDGKKAFKHVYVCQN